MSHTGAIARFPSEWRLPRKFVANSTGGMMHLSRDFREFVESLNASGVRYLVVGGYAVAAHGHPRYTKDLDVWVECTALNAGRVLKALSKFGLADLAISEADFLQEGNVIQIGQPPQRIDLMTAASGLRFEDCYPHRMPVVIDGVAVDFIDLQDLLRNKAATGRAQDKADIEALKGRS